MPRLRVGLCIPVYNGGARWVEALKAYQEANLAFERKLVFDSSSSDDSARLAELSGFEVLSISKGSFDHGGTRQQMVQHLSGSVDIVIFATQDAIPEDAEAIGKLLNPFLDEKVGAAYARQMPHRDADAFGAHARIFNYPAISRTVFFEDVAELGIKAAFLSNSFAAYRVSALDSVGGFPKGIILGEDTIVAARMIKAGWGVAYQAEARVRHSHNYRFYQEFKRYFDIGVMHAREPWLLAEFGKPEGEGIQYLRSEFRYIVESAPWLSALVAIRNGAKYFGYRAGRAESLLPLWLKRRLTMNRAYWGE